MFCIIGFMIITIFMKSIQSQNHIYIRDDEKLFVFEGSMNSLYEVNFYYQSFYQCNAFFNDETYTERLKKVEKVFSVPLWPSDRMICEFYIFPDFNLPIETRKDFVTKYYKIPKTQCESIKEMWITSRKNGDMAQFEETKTYLNYRFYLIKLSERGKILNI